MNNKEFLTISEAAKELGVSINTLRRWDESGKLVSVKKEGSRYRYYRPKDLMISRRSIFRQADDWVRTGAPIPNEWYCPTRDVFESRLISLQNRMVKQLRADVSLLIVMAGEIGNNSFDHNLGQWPDQPGIFFADDPTAGIITLADRGLGVLTTLRRIRPSLASDDQALRLAFTETISGRAQENRGNGLKLVRQVVAENPYNIFFQSGQAELRLIGGSPDLHLTRSITTLPGCLTMIEYPPAPLSTI